MNFWQLLQPSEVFDTRGRYEHCLSLWNRMDAAKQQRIYQLIAAKRQQAEFVNPNPCFALDDALQEDEQREAKTVKNRRQTLSFRDYYARYGTTEETDGWHRQFLPEKQTTIYVKS